MNQDRFGLPVIGIRRMITFDNPHLSLIEFIQLEQHISAVLGLKVDLVERDMLKPTIGQNILQEAVAI